MRVSIIPSKMKIGGPAVFRRKLEVALTERGTVVSDHHEGHLPDAMLVINGTRHLLQLVGMKRKGVRIVQRLGLPNNPHYYLAFGKYWFLYAYLSNMLMNVVRKRLADHIVYQSRFVEKTWNEKYGEGGAKSSIIYNGVDLKQFKPDGARYQSEARICVISVEGMQSRLSLDLSISVVKDLLSAGIASELLIFGRPWKNANAKVKGLPFVKFFGHISNGQLPFYYRGATLYLLTDTVSACSNCVLEALACGAPVVGYGGGVLPELLDERAGLCVNGSDKGGSSKSIELLVKATLRIFEENESFRIGARSLAERRYGLEQMVDYYNEVLVA